MEKTTTPEKSFVQNLFVYNFCWLAFYALIIEMQEA